MFQPVVEYTQLNGQIPFVKYMVRTESPSTLGTKISLDKMTTYVTQTLKLTIRKQAYLVLISRVRGPYGK